MIGSRRIAILCVALGLTLAIQILLGKVSRRPPRGQSRSDAERMDIAESAFRHLFVFHDNGSIYYLELMGKDPPATLLERLEDAGPQVHGISERTAKGNCLSISRIEYVTDSKVEVDTGYSDAISGRGDTFVMELQNGGWIVTGISGGYFADSFGL
jgi:hypothetical protein